MGWLTSEQNAGWTGWVVWRIPFRLLEPLEHLQFQKWWRDTLRQSQQRRVQGPRPCCTCSPRYIWPGPRWSCTGNCDIQTKCWKAEIFGKRYFSRLTIHLMAKDITGSSRLTWSFPTKVFRCVSQAVAVLSFYTVCFQLENFHKKSK